MTNYDFCKRWHSDHRYHGMWCGSFQWELQLYLSTPDFIFCAPSTCICLFSCIYTSTWPYIYTLFVLAVAIVMASSSAGPSHSQTIAPHTEFWPDVALVLPNKGSMARDMVCQLASPLHTWPDLLTRWLIPFSWPTNATFWPFSSFLVLLLYLVSGL